METQRGVFSRFGAPALHRRLSLTSLAGMGGTTPRRQESPLPAQPGWAIRRILVATNFSPCSAGAVARAAILARRCKARLTVLHVIDINPTEAFNHCGSAEGLMRELWVHGTTAMHGLARSLAETQVAAQPVIVEGLPWEEIVERSRNFGLVILGKTRLRPVRSVFSQHTVDRVVEQASCPVLVVHELADALETQTRNAER